MISVTQGLRLLIKRTTEVANSSQVSVDFCKFHVIGCMSVFSQFHMTVIFRNHCKQAPIPAVCAPKRISVSHLSSRERAHQSCARACHCCQPDNQIFHYKTEWLATYQVYNTKPLCQCSMSAYTRNTWAHWLLPLQITLRKEETLTQCNVAPDLEIWHCLIGTMIIWISLYRPVELWEKSCHQFIIKWIVRIYCHRHVHVIRRFIQIWYVVCNINLVQGNITKLFLGGASLLVLWGRLSYIRCWHSGLLKWG